MENYTLNAGTLEAVDPILGLSKFTQSGGELRSSLETETYEVAGDVGDSFDKVTIGKELIVSAGELERDSFDLPTITLKGGKITGDLNVDTLNYSGGEHIGTITVANELNLSGGELTLGELYELPVFTQSGGKYTGNLNVDTFNYSGGVRDGTISVAEALNLSGGELTLGELYDLPVFALSGGKYTGNLNVDTFDYSGGEVAGWINAADAINVSADTGKSLTAAMELRGDAKFTKTGAGSLTLSNQANAFTGDVSIEGGTLEVIDDALPYAADVDIADGSMLQFTISDDTEAVFSGTMTGDRGTLVKGGKGALTLTSKISLGDLVVNAGLLNIGDGTSTETASFDSAVIAKDATLYIASGATLEIRVPNHLTNNGTLINDGTVIDDLDNAGSFRNNHDYDADVASNTGVIDNNKPGVWTGNIESNHGRINNNAGAAWDGAVDGNDSRIVNAGTWVNGTVTNGSVHTDTGADGAPAIYNEYTATWTGDVAQNFSYIFNNGGTWFGDVGDNRETIVNDNYLDGANTGHWVGDVARNSGIIFNGGGGDWDGDVISNNGYIRNDAKADNSLEALADWKGDIYGNSNTIENGGTWTGDIISAGTLNANTGNTGVIYNVAATSKWTGDVYGNTADGVILNGASSR